MIYTVNVETALYIRDVEGRVGASDDSATMPSLGVMLTALVAWF